MDLSKANKAALTIAGLKIGGTAVVLGVGFLLVRKLIKGKNPDGTSSREAPSLKDFKIDTSKLTISPSDAALFANSIYGAMLNFGTDEETIFSVFSKLNTKDDLLLLIKTFGMKQYLWGARTAFIGQNFNLIGWLRSELTNDEIAKIKPKFDGFGIPL